MAVQFEFRSLQNIMLIEPWELQLQAVIQLCPLKQSSNPIHPLSQSFHITCTTQYPDIYKNFPKNFHLPSSFALQDRSIANMSELNENESYGSPHRSDFDDYCPNILGTQQIN
jgi:hypothetical protein